MLHTIRRAVVLRTDDPFVVAMNRAFRVTESMVDLQECNVVGVEIRAGIVFYSAQAAAQKIVAG